MIMGYDYGSMNMNPMNMAAMIMVPRLWATIMNPTIMGHDYGATIMGHDYGFVNLNCMYYNNYL